MIPNVFPVFDLTPNSEAYNSVLTLLTDKRPNNSEINKEHVTMLGGHVSHLQHYFAFGDQGILFICNPRPMRPFNPIQLGYVTSPQSLIT